MNCCISIAVEPHRLTEREAASLRQHRKVFASRPFFLFAPEGCPWTKDYEALLAPCHVRRVPVAAFKDPLCMSRLRLTPDFYAHFDGYDYVLVTSVESWPIHDALDWWMRQGYDYLTAPWLGLGGAGSSWVRGLDLPRGGCEFCSLRRVEVLSEYCRQLHLSGFDLLKHPIREDIVLSGGLPEDRVKWLPEIRYCPRAEQARFAWNSPEIPDGVADVSPSRSDLRTLMAITRGRMPMMMFRPTPDAYSRFCIPDEGPGTIYMFSSAVKPEYDYSKVVTGDGLLVFMNACHAFRSNESGRRLALSAKRIVTMHNDTVCPPFGPAYFGEIPLWLAANGYAGRHDSYTLRWRPYQSKTRSQVTYDGEIIAARETEILRSVGPEVRKGAPTCGYQAYRIMRGLHPDARIVLVNFFGNSTGFRVCPRHDPDWEQAEYRKDANLEFAYTEKRK